MARAAAGPEHEGADGVEVDHGVDERALLAPEVETIGVARAADERGPRHVSPGAVDRKLQRGDSVGIEARPKVPAVPEREAGARRAGRDFDARGPFGGGD